jgi:tRNA (adenine57-N1/adenine58-N1)-methyltransferase
MVGHTGFLITARRLADGTVLPNLKRRAGKAEFSDEDIEAWTPGAVGERATSDKKLRKVARQSAAQARKVAAAEASSAAVPSDAAVAPSEADGVPSDAAGAPSGAVEDER